MSKTTDNPFASFDLTKMFSDLKLPGLDPAALAAAQQKNIEALTAANKRAYEGYQALAKRQAEIFKDNLEELAGMLKNATPSNAADINPSKQADLVRQTVEKALANMRELSEMLAKTNTEAFELINKRLQENLEELRKHLPAGAR
jgi:phasin family protein